MSGNEAFELVGERGWSRGFDNMLRSGLARWFKTRSWWVNCLIWGGLAALIVSAVAFTAEAPPLEELLAVTLIFTGLFPAVGIIIVMQDAIVGEKKEGTAAWVLSKPLTRSAFVLSKIVANSIGALLTMTFVPCVLGFAIIAISHKSTLVPLGLLEAIGVIFINLFFFLTLTLMLGSFFSSRAPVIGISLAILFLQQQLINVFPFLRFVLPWNLIAPVGSTNPIAFALILGNPVQSEQLITLAMIVLESILFIFISIWRFNREEF